MRIGLCPDADGGDEAPDFATSQKFYGATRPAKTAAAEVRENLSACKTNELVGSADLPTHLNEAEVKKLKAFSFRFKKCTRQESNLQPSVPKTDALSN